eukprot:scaffold273147_cov30-Tisochrysis_lutea.AAC.1
MSSSSTASVSFMGTSAGGESTLGATSRSDPEPGNRSGPNGVGATFPSSPRIELELPPGGRSRGE